MSKAHTWNGEPPRHIEYARNLATRLGRANISTRIGMPIKRIPVTETISEKTKRILAECDAILCK
jgi:hypothetical protein